MAKATDYSYPPETPDVSACLMFYKYEYKRNRSAPLKTLSHMINLPFPIAFNEGYSMQVRQTDLSVLGNGLNDLAAAGSDIKTVWNSSEKFLEAVSQSAATIGALGFGTDSTIQNALQTRLGLIRNPHTTSLFEGVNLRNFTLAWKFSPRNESEAAVLDAIIERIKFLMHPQVSFGGFALDYPDLVTVEFRSSANPKLNKMLSRLVIYDSFVTDLQVDPTSAGQAWSTAGPVVYTIQMHLQEINIITRNTLDKSLNEGINPLVTNENRGSRAGGDN